MGDHVFDALDLAFVDFSGKYIDGSNFAFLNLRFTQLELLLNEMIENGEKTRILSSPQGSLGKVSIQMLDNAGNFWRVWQDKGSGKNTNPDPAIRFLYSPREGIIRPIDYFDPFVQLEGDRRMSQLLIASFLIHWLSGILALSETCAPSVSSATETSDSNDQSFRSPFSQ